MSPIAHRTVLMACSLAMIGALGACAAVADRQDAVVDASPTRTEVQAEVGPARERGDLSTNDAFYPLADRIVHPGWYR